MSFQQAIEAIIAIYLSFLPAQEAPPAPAPAPAAQPAAPAPAPAPAPTAPAPWVVLNASGSVTDMNTGWITYPSGATKCVTAAPCEDDEAFTGADTSVYNWETGEAYQDSE